MHEDNIAKDRACTEKDRQLAGMEKKLAETKASEEMANMMVGPLETMRFVMKQEILNIQDLVLKAGVSKKRKRESDDFQAPFYYSLGGNASKQGDLPWDSEEDRVMTPSEAVACCIEQQPSR
mmetsp:Transcript_104657/g.301803  ORF Transcript_104657/g.301803 Transcript_104657/m.301803 type:complete len:122 (+) Transcript_104657:248-613(+)